MGHTFLFRGEPKGRADGLDWWLSILSADAMMLSEVVGGSRSLAKLSESFETLAVERKRKGKARYRENVTEVIERLVACESAMMADSRGKVCIYPSLARHLEKKAQYALRLARSQDVPLVCGASAMREVSFGLSLVCDVAHLCLQYLDPSERMMMSRVRAVSEMLDDKLSRALCFTASGRCGYADFLAESDGSVTMYRRLLRELAARSDEGRLFSVFPPSFLVWSDGTCALVHRLLKRLINGKSAPDVAQEDEDDASTDVMRTVPMMILAEHSGAEDTTCEQPCDVREEEETNVQEEPIVEAEAEPQAAMIVSTEALSVPERICAKASDYKNIIEKAVKKGREHGARTPRPLGKGR